MWGHEGPPMLPAGYFPNLEIVQSPGQVAVLQEITHNARVIPVAAGPHVASSIRQYGGDSRGHWEGDTLVVESKNFTDLTQFRGASQQMVVTERFTMADADNINYEFTVTRSRYLGHTMEGRSAPEAHTRPGVRVRVP